MADDYWKPSMKVLSDVKFLDSLINFDKDNVPQRIMDRIRKNYLSNPSFVPEKIKSASTACEGLSKWVHAISKYDEVVKVIGPKREALAQAEADENEANEKVAVKRQQYMEIQVFSSSMSQCLVRHSP